MCLCAFSRRGWGARQLSCSSIARVPGDEKFTGHRKCCPRGPRNWLKFITPKHFPRGRNFWIFTCVQFQSTNDSRRRKNHSSNLIISTLASDVHKVGEKINCSSIVNTLVGVSTESGWRMAVIADRGDLVLESPIESRAAPMIYILEIELHDVTHNLAASQENSHRNFSLVSIIHSDKGPLRRRSSEQRTTSTVRHIYPRSPFETSPLLR